MDIHSFDQIIRRNQAKNRGRHTGSKIVEQDNISLYNETEKL